MFGVGMWPKPFVYPRLPFASPVELFLTQQTYYTLSMAVVKRFYQLILRPTPKQFSFLLHATDKLCAEYFQETQSSCFVREQHANCPGIQNVQDFALLEIEIQCYHRRLCCLLQKRERQYKCSR